VDTFSHISQAAEKHFKIVHRDKFVLGVELDTGGNRHQTVFLAELIDDDDRRYLRLETAVAPLGNHDPIKLLRINLTLRVGYLAVGDLESVAFLKLCKNNAYRYLTEQMLIDDIRQVAKLGDQIEQMLMQGGDWF